MKNILSFVILCCFASVLHATTHYAAPDGTADFIVSSPTNPMTLEFAYFSCAPGDSLLLEGSFIREEELYVTLTDFYIGEYGAGASLEGDYDNTTEGFPLITLRYPTNVTVENLTFSNHFGNYARGILVWGSGDNVNIKDNVFTNIGWNTDPAEIADFSEGSNAILVVGNVNTGSLTDVNITGNAVTNIVLGRSEAITLIGNVDGFLVADNYLSDLSNIGIDAAGHFSWVADYDPPFDPLDPVLNQARNGIVRNNTVINAVSPIATSAGLYCDGCRDVLFERNVVKGCGAGISIGCEVGGNKTASHVTVINNIFKENLESGMFLGSLTSEGSANGPSSVDDCVVRNNTFYNNCQTDGADTFNDYEIFLQNSNNNIFKNNILYMLNTARGIVAAGTSEVVNFEMDYNLFYRPDQSELDLVISSATSTLEGNVHSQYGDPGFAGETSDLFDISISGRAANAGDPDPACIPAGELDRDGGVRVQGSIADIGAQESASTQEAPIPNTEFAIFTADLTCISTIIPSNANGITNSVMTVKIQELGNANTEGIITVIIPKDDRLTFSYDATLSAIGPFAVNNEDWVYDGSNGSFHIWTSDVEIEEISSSTFGFEAVYDPQNASGIVSFTSTIFTGSGGEENGANNIDVETLLYFSN